MLRLGYVREHLASTQVEPTRGRSQEPLAERLSTRQSIVCSVLRQTIVYTLFRSRGSFGQKTAGVARLRVGKTARETDKSKRASKGPEPVRRKADKSTNALNQTGSVPRVSDLPAKVRAAAVCNVHTIQRYSGIPTGLSLV
jgi:hypothetical protein